MIWLRMVERGDFPTLRQELGRIVSAMDNIDSSTSDLVQAVLSDFSLTQQVIRLANSAMYSAFGGDVTTVTRAVSVLGADAIGHLALGLQMLDDFVGLSETRDTAREELRLTLVASAFTRRITAGRGIREAEEAVVCTLMRYIARLLLVFYCPEYWVQIEQLASQDGETLSSACENVLGVSLDEIAGECAQRWGLPSTVAESMAACGPAVGSRLDTHASWLKGVAMLSGDVTEMIGKGVAPAALKASMSDYAEWLGFEPCDFQLVVDEAKSFHDSLVRGGGRSEDSTSPGQIRKTGDSATALRRGLEHVRAVGDVMAVGTLVPLVLETLMHSLNLDCAIGFFLNRSNKRFEARIGLGAGVPSGFRALGFEEGFLPDVFHVALTHRSTVIFEDSADDKTRNRLPAWYLKEFQGVRSFLLIPVHVRDRCIGLLYGSWGKQQGVALRAGEDALVYRFGEEIAKGFQRLIAG